MKKTAVLAGLGDIYQSSETGYRRLPFVYKNIRDLSARLIPSWDVPQQLLDGAATKEGLVAKLREVINSQTERDAWLLFYFTGHGNRSYDAKTGSMEHYLVTYNDPSRYGRPAQPEDFFTETDYEAIITQFHNKCPDGHLITVLDCCFAFGMIENFSLQAQYHSIIAASSENASAYYNTNSLFFQAFLPNIKAPLYTLAQRINTGLAALGAPAPCKVKIATPFTDSTLIP